MRILYLALCLMAVTASPARTFRRNQPRKIEEKIESIKEEEVLENKEKTEEARAIFEQINVVSSTLSSLDGAQEFTPHAISLPPVNIGWPQASSTIPPLTLKDEKKSLLRGHDPDNVYTVNIYINFNEDGLVFEDESHHKKDSSDQRKKKPRPKPTTSTTTEEYDWWYVDYVNLKDNPETPECPDGFKKFNGKCARRKCQKNEALVGGACVPMSTA